MCWMIERKREGEVRKDGKDSGRERESTCGEPHRVLPIQESEKTRANNLSVSHYGYARSPFVSFQDIKVPTFHVNTLANLTNIIRPTCTREEKRRNKRKIVYNGRKGKGKRKEKRKKKIGQ